MLPLNWIHDKIHHFSHIFSAYGSDTPGWSLVDSFVIVYKSILMLGANVNTDSLNKRISYLTILFAGILLYWLWEAQLISYFSFPSKSLPFNNLAEFLEKSDNKVWNNWYQRVVLIAIDIMIQVI